MRQTKGTVVQVEELAKYGLDESEFKQLRNVPVGYPVTIIKSINRSTREESLVEYKKVSYNELEVIRHYTNS